MPADETAELRASDADRERVVDRLKEHCAEGRLTLEELAERVDRAYAARTTDDLEALERDLPAAVAHAAPAAEETRRGGPRLPGFKPFLESLEADRPRPEVVGTALRAIAPPLTRYGYELVAHGHDSMEFEMSERPLSATVVGVVTFPFGGFLLFFYKRRSRVCLSFEEVTPRRTRITAHGSAPLRVRRAFAELGATGDRPAG